MSLALQSGVHAALPKFGNTPDKLPVDQYARKLAGNSFLGLYEVPPSGNIKFPWLFAHRDKAKAAVHALTIIKNAKGEEVIELLVTRRPPLGGKLTLETHAGMWNDGDPDQKALDTANREVKEESGYTVDSSRMLFDGVFATSPGMTTEMKAIAITRASGEPSDRFQEMEEKDVIVGKVHVPLATFQNYDLFMDWLKDQSKTYTVGMDVIAARGLLPPTIGQNLNAEA